MASSSRPPSASVNDSSPMLEPDLQDLVRYISGEYLAHTFAYAENLEHNSVLTVDGIPHYKLLKLKTSHSNSGLVAYVFQPLQNSHSDLHVVFRGTSADRSILRDLEIGGAGNFSFKANEESLMAQLNQIISETEPSQKIVINVYGHSLGAADAQYCYVSLMKKIADKSLNNMHYARINGLRLMAYSAPGIPKSITDEADKLALEVHSSVALELYWLLAAGDGVQSTGEKNLLCDVSPDIARVHLIKVYAADEIESKTIGWLSAYRIFDPRRTITAHCTSYFGPDNKPHKQEYYNNFQPHSHVVLNKKLNNKSYLLQTKLFTWSQTLFATIGHWYYPAQAHELAASSSSAAIAEPAQLSQSDTLLAVLKTLSIATIEPISRPAPTRHSASSQPVIALQQAIPASVQAERERERDSVAVIEKLQDEKQQLALALTQTEAAKIATEASHQLRYNTLITEQICIQQAKERQHQQILLAKEIEYQQSLLLLHSEIKQLRLASNIAKNNFLGTESDLNQKHDRLQTEKESVLQSNAQYQKHCDFLQSELLQLQSVHRELQKQLDQLQQSHQLLLTLQTSKDSASKIALDKLYQQHLQIKTDLEMQVSQLRGRLISVEKTHESAKSALEKAIVDLSCNNQQLQKAMQNTQEQISEQKQINQIGNDRIQELVLQNTELADQNQQIQMAQDALRLAPPIQILKKPWWQYALAGAAIMLGLIAIGSGIGVLVLGIQALIAEAVISCGSLILLSSSMYLSQLYANDNIPLQPYEPALPVKPIHPIVLPIDPAKIGPHEAQPEPAESKAYDVPARSPVQSNGLFARSDQQSHSKEPAFAAAAQAMTAATNDYDDQSPRFHTDERYPQFILSQA